ncbi:unnamed protein product [Auanema sp. JU1783]|nr:unnamed protein product [Auanema sp. JU1783]
MTSKTTFLTIDPKDTISFEGRLDKEVSAILMVTNDTNTSQCLKIKCTNNAIFRIRPVISIVGAGGTAQINVTYMPNGKTPVSYLHHIGVYHIPAPEGCSAIAVWDEHYGPPQGQFRLKVHILRFINILTANVTVHYRDSPNNIEYSFQEMYQQRVSSASSSSSKISQSLERSRVQSAPPSKYDRRYPHKFAEQDGQQKPMTPDPEYVTRVLQARISSALAGPEIRLSQTRSATQSLEDNPTTIPTRKLLFGRSSLKRTPAFSRTGTANLIPIEDPEELAMLRSIARSDHSFESTVNQMNQLRIHEFEDKSDEDEDVLLRSNTSTTQRRRRSLVRQLEQDDSFYPKDTNMRENVVSNMEDRLSGFRHEKMRSSTKSGEGDGIIQIAGLVYDADFDCYYNPEDDTYYRVNSVEKPIAS